MDLRKSRTMKRRSRGVYSILGVFMSSTRSWTFPKKGVRKSPHSWEIFSIYCNQTYHNLSQSNILLIQ